MNNDDYETILLLAGGCSLDSSPKKNWVENSGGLPNYICRIARAIMRGGKTKSQAIAIAVSRAKKWAAGGDDVDADTRAKAAKAVAQWEALKAKNKSKKVISASRVTSEGEDVYLMLSEIPSFKTDIVRLAWDAQERIRRNAWEAEHPREFRSAGDAEKVDVSTNYYPYRWIKELWTDFIVVETESKGQPELVKIKYTVNPITQDVTFGEEVEVRQVYIEMDEDLSDAEKELLGELLQD